MREYIENEAVIVIADDEGDSVRMTPAQFYAFEPSATPLPAGMMRRYWSPTLTYLSDGANQLSNEGFSAEAYCQKVGTYQDLLSVDGFTFAVVDDDLITTDDAIMGDD